MTLHGKLQDMCIVLISVYRPSMFDVAVIAVLDAKKIDWNQMWQSLPMH